MVVLGGWINRGEMVNMGGWVDGGMIQFQILFPLMGKRGVCGVDVTKVSGA